MKISKLISYIALLGGLLAFSSAQITYSQLPTEKLTPVLSTSYIFNAPILAVQAIDSTNIYAAGSFTSQQGFRYVAAWNGQMWSEVGTGIAALKANDNISLLHVVSATDIYAAGDFSDAQGRRYVAHWNGTAWQAVGNWGVNATILAMKYISSSEIYIAGKFTNGAGYCFVAKWNGATWSEVGNLKANGKIYTIDVVGNHVYAAGDFTDSTYARYVAHWDGASWQALGTGKDAIKSNGCIEWMWAKSPNAVYADGTFVGNHHWNGTQWLNTKSNYDNNKYSHINIKDAHSNYVLFTEDHLYSTGSGTFNHATFTLYPIDSGAVIYGDYDLISISAISVLSRKEVYAAGTIPSLGNAYAVMKYRNGIWIPVCSEQAYIAQSSLPANIDCLGTASDTTVFVLADGVVNQWKNENWKPCALPHQRNTDEIMAMEVLSDSQAYVINKDGSRVWKWDGAAWQVLDSSLQNGLLGYKISDRVPFKALPDGNLYFGRYHWNGFAWSLMTNGLPANHLITQISPIAATDVYAFSRDTLSTENRMIHWDGTMWTSVSILPNLYGDITALQAITSNEIYAYFNLNIWKWNGAQWQKLDSAFSDFLSRDASIKYISSQKIYFMFNIVYFGFDTYHIFQWNGSALTSFVEAGRKFMAFDVASSGNVYFSLYTNYYPTVYRTIAQPISRKPIITAQPQTHRMCAGEWVSLTVGARYANAFQWQDSTANGWADILGATNNTLSIGAMSAALHGKKFRSILQNTGSGKRDTSKVVALEFTATLVPDVQISNQVNSCNASVVVGMRATHTGYSPIYTWYVNGYAVGTGFTTPSFLQDKDTVRVSLQSSLSCASPAIVMSNAIIVKALPQYIPTPTIKVLNDSTIAASVSPLQPYYAYDWAITAAPGQQQPFHYLTYDSTYTYHALFSNTPPQFATVTIRDFLGCKSSESKRVMFLLAADNAADKVSILAYPNPVQDVLNIRIEGITGAFTCSLYDIQGSLLRTASVLLDTENTFSWRTDALPSGVFVLSVSNGKKSWNVKFVK